MNWKLKQRIEDLAHDCVIGTGLGEEMLASGNDTPTREHLHRLEKIVQPEFMVEAQKLFLEAWRRCLQACAQR